MALPFMENICIKKNIYIYHIFQKRECLNIHVFLTVFNLKYILTPSVLKWSCILHMVIGIKSLLQIAVSNNSESQNHFLLATLWILIKTLKQPGYFKLLCFNHVTQMPTYHTRKEIIFKSLLVNILSKE